jgi:hypothetical protein
MHLGKDIGPGNWEPILDHDTFARLVSLLRDPARRTNTGAPRSRYLLSGIARCGRCPKPGVPMRVLAPAGKVPAYVRPECFLRRSRERVDELVTTVMVELLAKPTALEILAQTTDDGEVQRLTDQRDTLRAKLVNVQDDYIEDRITEDQRDQPRRCFVPNWSGWRPSCEPRSTRPRARTGPDGPVPRGHRRDLGPPRPTRTQARRDQRSPDHPGTPPGQRQTVGSQVGEDHGQEQEDREATRELTCALRRGTLARSLCSRLARKRPIRARRALGRHAPPLTNSAGWSTGWPTGCAQETLPIWLS